MAQRAPRPGLAMLLSGRPPATGRCGSGVRVALLGVRLARPPMSVASPARSAVLGRPVCSLLHPAAITAVAPGVLAGRRCRSRRKIGVKLLDWYRNPRETLNSPQIIPLVLI